MEFWSFWERYSPIFRPTSHWCTLAFDKQFQYPHHHHHLHFLKSCTPLLRRKENPLLVVLGNFSKEIKKIEKKIWWTYFLYVLAVSEGSFTLLKRDSGRCYCLKQVIWKKNILWVMSGVSWLVFLDRFLCFYYF